MARARGESNGQAKLTRDQAAAIVRAYESGGTSLRKLASDYGVSLGTIQGIVHGKTWSQPETAPSGPIAPNVTAPEAATGSLAPPVVQGHPALPTAVASLAAAGKLARLAELERMRVQVATVGAAAVVAGQVARSGSAEARPAIAARPVVPLVVANEQFYDDVAPSRPVAPAPVRGSELLTKESRVAELARAKLRARARL